MGGAGLQQTTQSWGVNGDEAVPGDYHGDGDGKTDFSIFRRSAGEWYCSAIEQQRLDGRPRVGIEYGQTGRRRL